jgi:hypothetical protein
MIGYPDETMEEIKRPSTWQGTGSRASSANFMLVIPLPGSVCIRGDRQRCMTEIQP